MMCGDDLKKFYKLPESEDTKKHFFTVLKYLQRTAETPLSCNHPCLSCNFVEPLLQQTTQPFKPNPRFLCQINWLEIRYRRSWGVQELQKKNK